MNDPNRNVRAWTEEDERKYREIIATPVKRLTEQEQFELGAVSPYPPLGASKKVTNQDLDLNKPAETPFFSDNDNFAQAITEAGIKAAKATHEFNMKEIKAKLIADLCKELVKTPMRHEDIPQRAREIAENALKEI